MHLLGCVEFIYPFIMNLVYVLGLDHISFENINGTSLRFQLFNKF